MKKLSLFLLGFVATSFMASAQITSDMFVLPANTGANMTVGVNASKFDQFEGGQIGAFYELEDTITGEFVLRCAGLESIAPGFFGLALWGDDSSTPYLDGLPSGAVPQFAILYGGEVLSVAEIPQFTGYVTNGIVNITDAEIFSDLSGCTDTQACNVMSMYVDVNYVDDGSCAYPEQYYDCEGLCLNDDDQDGVCNELEVEGCQDTNACNFLPSATDDAPPGSDLECSYADDGYDCDGVCLADADSDGVCDPFEVPGCQDPAYDNYSSIATDPDTCIGLLGCTDPNYFEFNEAASVDDGSCSSEIFPGCTNSAAQNYDPNANFNIPAGQEGACIIVGVNFTPASDTENTSVSVTSNNMSVYFPANSEQYWDTLYSNVQVGDIVAAVYETKRLENDFLGYSAISGLANAGSGVWNGGQFGLSVFGADNGLNNGYQPGESLKWLVSRGGVVYEATADYITPNYDGTYQENLYISVRSLIVSDVPADHGCTDPNFMEYDPLAEVDDGTHCLTYISVGCLDANFVNWAGPGADTLDRHDNSENFEDAFSQNYSINLDAGNDWRDEDKNAISNSEVAAIFNDIDVCQSHVPGCTYPFAGNYDSSATEDDGDCDWSAYSHHSIDTVTGVYTSTLYTFGGDNDDSNNLWVGSDFEYANDLYQNARIGTGHIVTDLIASYDAYTERRKADSTFLSDTLIDVANWFAADEEADSALLKFVRDSALEDHIAYVELRDNQFNTMYDHLTDSIARTLDSAYNAHVDYVEFRDNEYNTMYLFLTDSIARTLDSAYNAHVDYVELRDQELADTSAAAQGRFDHLKTVVSGSPDGSLSYDVTDSYYTRDLDQAHGIIGHLQDALNYHADPIKINLQPGWNTVAYYLNHPTSVVAQFEEQFLTETLIQENINIVKNNEGLFYWPDFLFNGLGLLRPGQGYQVRVKDGVDEEGKAFGKEDFVFTSSITPDEERLLSPTVPAWALEMEVENHPNDIRTLVRVVNMLGQEVAPSNRIAGEVLLYLYNDGTVEKKMVE